ncbi:MAG: hypothetical protein ABIJ65_12305, partial [Chloroflexota bacterium]
YCYFFDKVGWLGAAGLIDVDYILAPMQHYLRRAWIAMEPLINRSREFSNDKPYDPVYQWGFEWLYLRTNQTRKHQARLLRRIFSNPSLLSKKDFVQLLHYIDADEENYRNLLKEFSNVDKIEKKVSDNN